MHTQYRHKFEYHMNACGSAAKQFHVHCLYYAECKSTSVSLGDSCDFANTFGSCLWEYMTLLLC